MAPRNPEITARNKRINQMTAELNSMQPAVLKLTGFETQFSLHGKIGGKHAHYIDIKNEVIVSPEHFIMLWLEGFRKKIESLSYPGGAEYETYSLLRKYKVFQEYLYLFLQRTYWRNYEALSKKRPTVDEAEVYIGQNNADYGLLITPRFKNGAWENDKSEVRHFKKKYWTIGHVLETGFVVPGKDQTMPFESIEAYLNFFLNVLVRNSGSEYEYKLAEMYCDFVRESATPEDIPLMIPEFRYNGIEKKHKHRLDFTIIDQPDLNKIGFELSPWSSHGHIPKTKEKSNKEINQIASSNFEREMTKHKDYFKRHGIFALIYTDSDLQKLELIFADMKKYLELRTSGQQLKLQILDEFFKGPKII